MSSGVESVVGGSERTHAAMKTTNATATRTPDDAVTPTAASVTTARPEAGGRLPVVVVGDRRQLLDDEIRLEERDDDADEDALTCDEDVRDEVDSKCTRRVHRSTVANYVCGL